jgi:hypothetical protein
MRGSAPGLRTKTLAGVLTSARTRIGVGAETTSTGQVVNNAAAALADQLGTRVVEFPGDHGGYVALPEESGRLLEKVLSNEAKFD